jgi:diacylglycerol kinase family enzyme
VVNFDDEEVRQGALLLAVGVGPRVGGGFRITPDARFDDGLLDSCLVEPVGRLTMLAMLARVMRGTHVSASFVEMRRNRVIRIESDLPLPVHVDGEIFATVADNVQSIKLTCLPERLAIMS